ncbi:MAG: polyprenyl synthetase family protein [Pseudomonadota bacterium]
MEFEEVFDLVSDDLQKVELELSKHVMSQVLLIPEVANYILLSGGKRFRPLVLILAAKLCGYAGNHHVPLASVFEFIHTASLLHDDVVDNAEIRRGSSSVNSVWGNETSVLLGDYLFSKSFSLVTSIGDLKVLRVLSEATTRLAEGEIMELMKSGDPHTTEEDYISIITEKTAVLISAACQVGAILGNASHETEKALRGFGLNLGIAFQLVDDILDYTSTEEQFGKAIGKDLHEGKITLPLIHTLRVCSDSDRERITKIIESDDHRGPDLSILLTIINLIKQYEGVEHTFNRARGYVEIAKGFLRDFDTSREKQALLAMADYVIERKW